MLRSPCSLPWFVVLLALTGCDQVDDTSLDITHDPFHPLVLVPSSSATEEQLHSIDDAISMWNEVADTQVTRERVLDAPQVPIEFQDAAPLFHGVYDDEAGVLIINGRLTDPRDRAITIAHELGHAFGLWHVDERRSVMNRGNLSIEPNARDAQAIAEMWSQIVQPGE